MEEKETKDRRETKHTERKVKRVERKTKERARQTEKDREIIPHNLGLSVNSSSVVSKLGKSP